MTAAAFRAGPPVDYGNPRAPQAAIASKKSAGAVALNTLDT